MALIYFYDATELDKEQLTASLSATDHHWEYVADHIAVANCNPDAEVVSMFVSSHVTRGVIEAMPKLKLIACRSTGFDNVDLQAAAEHGVTVVNVPTYGEDTVAEYTFTLLLALTRKLPAILAARNGYIDTLALRGRDLAGRTLGVVGTGHIGQKVLKIAKGFSMETIAYDAFPKDSLQEELGFRYAGLNEVLQQADIVSLHTPLLPGTRHLMNEERLGMMRQGAILVNTARGELVDTQALVTALDNGHLAGAAIDVVEGEALLDYHEEAALLRSDTLPEAALRHSLELSALEKMPNVILSPHNAFNTVEALNRINQTTAKNIIDFWYGNTPNQVVSPPQVFGKLLIARHTESTWNATGRWTGTRDAHLTDMGFKEAATLGHALRDLDIHIDTAFCSEQFRSRETLEAMLDTAQQFNIPVITSGAINERDYGEYTGKNKWEMEKLLGEKAFNNIRRGWNVPVPGGETLKMVSDRVVPFYTGTVLPLLTSGNNVLIVAHGNSLRALMKYLVSISDEGVANLEMLFGQIVVYDIGPDGRQTGSTVVKTDIIPPHA